MGEQAGADSTCFRGHPVSPRDRVRRSLWPTFERVAVLGLVGFALWVWWL
jgi:hypothetical protein